LLLLVAVSLGEASSYVGRISIKAFV